MSGPDRSGTLVMAALSAFLSSSVWQLGRFGQMIAAPGATRIGEERIPCDCGFTPAGGGRPDLDETESRIAAHVGTQSLLIAHFRPGFPLARE
jgi:hypothetical protein